MKFSIFLLLLLSFIAMQCSVTHVSYKKKHLHQRYYVNRKLPKHVQARKQNVLRDSVRSGYDAERYYPEDKMPVPIKTIPPKYPPEAEQADLEGTVWVKSLVDTNGNTTNAVVIKSDSEIFNAPSMDCALQWKFSPGRLNGKKAPMWVSIPFRFKLNLHKKTHTPDQIPTGEVHDSIEYSLKTVPIDTARENRIRWYNEYENVDYFPYGVMPIPIKQVEAEILNNGRIHHLKGIFTVWVKGLVDKQGNVLKAEVIKTDAEIFNDPAIAAALQWKFSPGLVNEKPAAVWVAIPFKFKFNQ